MKKLILLGIMFLSIFLFNCVEKNIVPEWVLNLPVENGVIYGIGNAKLTDSKNASKLAEEKAVISAVYFYDFMVNELILEYSNETEQLNPLNELDFEIKSIQLSWNVSDFKIIKHEQTSDGTWWCLVVYEPINVGNRFDVDVFRRMDEIINNK